MHSIDAIYQKSQQLGVEIFVEILDDRIMHENIGSESRVCGRVMSKGSTALHTHLDGHPPSIVDFLTGLRCTMIYNIDQSGVVGPDKIYYYRFKESLIDDFRSQIPKITRQTSSILFGSSDPCKNDEYVEYNPAGDLGASTLWINKFRINLAVINRLYIADGNDRKYIKKLRKLGIEMTIGKRCDNK